MERIFCDIFRYIILIGVSITMTMWIFSRMNLKPIFEFMEEQRDEIAESKRSRGKLEGEIADMRTSIHKLNTNMEKLDTRMEKLETKMESLETKMQSLETKMESLETKMEWLETKTENIEMKVDWLSNNITKTLIKQTSLNNSVFYSFNQTTFANGVFVNHPDLGLIVATNEHVIYNNDTKCYESSFLLNYMNNKTISRFERIFVHKSSDLVIIKPALERVEEIKLLKHAPLIDYEISEAGEIMGFCSYRGRYVYNHGKVIEMYGNGDEYQVESDIGGSFGFSGCGYYSNNNKLAYIHEGAGNLHYYKKNKGSSSNKELFYLNDTLTDIHSHIKSFFTSWNETSDIPFDGNITNFYNILHNIARNPRTRIIPARYLAEEENFLEVTDFCE